MKSATQRTALIAGAMTAALGVGLVAGRASADQPYMRTALDQLGAARATLAQGSDNKGGHRVAAIRDIDAAIGQVRAGIAYAGY